MVTTFKLRKGQAGGLALTQKYGREYMQAIGRKGGRPRSLTVEDIIPTVASVSPGQGKEQRHEKGHGELLRLWNIKQASSYILPKGGACLSSGERSSLEDSQHLGVGEHDLPKNNPKSIIYLVPLPQPKPTVNPDPSPWEGGEG